jgi:hypothetical protein
VPPPNGSQHTLRSPSRQNSFESRGAACLQAECGFSPMFRLPRFLRLFSPATYTLTAVFFLSYSPKLALINVCHSDTSEFLLTAFIFRNRQSTRSAGIVQMQCCFLPNVSSSFYLQPFTHRSYLRMPPITLLYAIPRVEFQSVVWPPFCVGIPPTAFPLSPLPSPLPLSALCVSLTLPSDINRPTLSCLILPLPLSKSSVPLSRKYVTACGPPGGSMPRALSEYPPPRVSAHARTPH